MIPTEIVKFLEGATVAFGATRDDELVPQIHLVESWSVGEDRRTITCLFPENYSKRLLPSLENNGRFSLVALGSTCGPQASHPPNLSVDFHECYQFKGHFVGLRSAGEGDHPLVERTAERFKALFQPMFGFSDTACAARFGKPALAVTFEVREIYDQTPGPGAGARIHNEEES